ncbi:MAG TPA: NUDIX domain-containing protein [Burkholderiales bacterium]|nr:NUDIX domain-containing protein [Burkholderiales bacterium]
MAGCIAEWSDKILLCRRAVEPAFDMWTLPAGFIEAEETAEKGARREILEEAGSKVELGRLFAVFNVPAFHQLHVRFLARLIALDFKAGPETAEVRLFGEYEIPWEKLAFTTTRETLKYYFADRKNGSFGFHFSDVVSFLP